VISTSQFRSRRHVNRIDILVVDEAHNSRTDIQLVARWCASSVVIIRVYCCSLLRLSNVNTSENFCYFRFLTRMLNRIHRR
jgi:hypothetical protein